MVEAFDQPPIALGKRPHSPRRSECLKNPPRVSIDRLHCSGHLLRPIIATRQQCWSYPGQNCYRNPFARANTLHRYFGRQRYLAWQYQMLCTGHVPSPLEAQRPSDRPASGVAPKLLSAHRSRLSNYRHSCRSHACVQYQVQSLPAQVIEATVHWLQHSGAYTKGALTSMMQAALQ